jgi:single stranded DNA-binding protein
MAGKSLNRVQLIGNLGKDPEIKYTPQGNACAKLTIATNERFKDKAGEWQDRIGMAHTSCSGNVWPRLRRVSEKRRQVYIEGRLQTRSWDDKTSGQKKHMTEVVARFDPSGWTRQGRRRRFRRKFTRVSLSPEAATILINALPSPKQQAPTDHRRRYTVLEPLASRPELQLADCKRISGSEPYASIRPRIRRSNLQHRVGVRMAVASRTS